LENEVLKTRGKTKLDERKPIPDDAKRAPRRGSKFGKVRGETLKGLRGLARHKVSWGKGALLPGSWGGRGKFTGKRMEILWTVTRECKEC